MGRAEMMQITKERSYSFEGYFDAKEMYQVMKGYLEDHKHYDVSEKDLDEQQHNGKRKIIAKFEAEQMFNDYYKIVLKYSITLTGKELEVELDGVKRRLTEGKAELHINGFIKPDFMNKREKGPLSEFFGKLYDKFFGRNEFNDCIFRAIGDINALLNTFKQQVNSKL